MREIYKLFLRLYFGLLYIATNLRKFGSLYWDLRRKRERNRERNEQKRKKPKKESRKDNE